MSKHSIPRHETTPQPPLPTRARPAGPRPVRQSASNTSSSIRRDAEYLLARDPNLADQPNIAFYLAMWDYRDGIAFPPELAARLLTATNTDSMERERRRVLSVRPDLD